MGVNGSILKRHFVMPFGLVVVAKSAAILPLAQRSTML